jgi:solute carrier family 25 S-adenosylmethionine transporter 26
MAGSFPAAATFWATYEFGKSVLAPALQGGPFAAAAPAAAAALADVAVTAVRNPFEVVKQQMQSGLHATTGQAVRTILRVDGLRGLYAGYFSTVLREIPFDAIEFALYEALKARLSAHRRRDLVLWENAALGSVAGGVAAALTTPLDVIKTRLMTQTRTAAADRYTGVVDAFVRIRREEGPGALLAGIRPRVAWISLGGAIFIGSFEELKRRLS